MRSLVTKDARKCAKDVCSGSCTLGYLKPMIHRKVRAAVKRLLHLALLDDCEEFDFNLDIAPIDGRDVS